MSRRLTLLFALSFLTFAGCAEQGMVDDASGALGERSDFRKAKSAGSSEAWTAFLEKYPQSASRDKAQAALDDAVWRETERTDTAAAYFAFNQNKPSHAMAGEARKRCKKHLADGRGAESDYLDYLRAFQDDPDASALRQALKGVRFEAARKGSNLENRALFVSEYPGAPEAAKLLPDMQRQAYQDAEKTGTRLAYQFFLKRYPNASDAPQAQAKLGRFAAASVPQGNAADLKKLLPQLRAMAPAFARRECQKGLSARLGQFPDLYGAEAEELRANLRELANSGDSAPRFCASLAMSVPAAGRQAAANAVRALAVLTERRQYLESVMTGPDRIAAGAQQTADQADTLADSSESGELEIEALYGNMPADPKKPDESATKNAREAARRAKRARELVKGMSKKDEISEIVDAVKRQTDLLVEVIASLERPSGSKRPQAAQTPSDEAAPAPAEDAQ
jgi:hypothetical protein